MTKPPDDAADEHADNRSRPEGGDADGRELPPPGPAPEPPAPTTSPPTSAPPERFWAKNGVALAGIVATLVAACVGSFFTYRTSIDSQQAERDQSSIQFQRDERKTAYSGFLAKALLLEDVEDKVMTTEYRRPLQIDQQAIDELKESQALNTEWQKASDELTRAAAALDLVGSGNVRFRALDLLDAHHDVSFAYTDMALARSKMPPDQKVIDAAVEQFESKRTDAAKVRFEFSQAASESLGISLLGP